MQLSFQKIFYTLASVIAFFAVLILAREVLIPLAFSFLVAFILYPLANKFESWGLNKILAAFLSILCLLLLIAGGIYLFSNQIIQLSQDLTDFKDKILNVFTEATVFINRNFGFLPDLEKGELIEKIREWFSKSSGKLISQTFSSTANIVFGLLTSVIFTFLILIYRDGMIRALVSFYPQHHHDKALNMFKSVQKVGQQYLFGMLIIVLILGLVNSIGLLIIGLDNPFLFGFMASVLAIIPYAGTFLGAAIPVLYAFLTHDSLLMPVSIAIFFWLVQIVESNFLTPKIVGGHMNINALTSILCIIIGASVWGVAGMILFLPYTAMLKTVCEDYEKLKPFAMLIGDENYNKKDRKESKWVRKIKGWFS
jgi:predicted PurR-regulated permease PerM